MSVDCTHTGSGTEYAVTSSANFDAVPWATLGPGDTVRIHNQGSPYYKQILVSSSGTPSQPIRICGVADSNGNLPEINGANATAYPGAKFGTGAANIQFYGGVTFYNYGAPYYGDSSSYPHDITLEGLRITGFNSSNTYTDISTGLVTPYDNFVACIRIQRGGSITLRGNEIDHCGNGIFTTSNSGVESRITRNLLVEGNYIHDNSNVGRYGEHQCYLQAFGLVVQGNYLAPTLPGSLGGQLKSRSVQQFLRYNFIERGARIFDIVEVQDTQPLVFPWIGLDAGELPYTSPSDVVANYEAYQTSYVYGNIVNNTGTNASLWIVHGVSDTFPQDLNPGGTLNFYFNTIYTDVSWGSGIVDFGPYQYAVNDRTVWPTAYLQNNAFFINQTNNPPYFYWNRYEADRVVLGKNWVSSTWGTGNPSGGPLTGISNAQVPAANVWQAGQQATQVSGISNLITGTSIPFDPASYIPDSSGQLVGSSDTLPVSIASLPPLMQYSATTHRMIVRDDIKDIGAVGLSAAIPVNGVCGSSNGKFLTIAPTANLCSTGSASTVGGSGPWTWICNGYNSGTNSSCLANDVSAVVIKEYPLVALSNPWRITSGSDGNLWFTERSSNMIGKMSTSGQITEYLIPTSASTPTSITSGPDGNIWFIEQTGNNIGRITTAGIITEFPVPTASGNSGTIVTGSDNNLWFTERSGNKIGKITPSGVITEFPILTTANSIPNGITTGSDGNLWFTEQAGNKIGQITPAGVITEYGVPTSGGQPFGITTGPDGKLWFTELAGNKIGRISTSGVISEFAVLTANSQPYNITTGQDNNLWFTELSGNKIGRITTSGEVIEFTIPTTGSQPSSIVSGSDGNLWFTEQAGNKIGQLALASIANTFTLSVSKAGAGTGTVTAQPGITNIGSGTYNSGTSVTLTAIADSGNVFTGWSGDCAGYGSCTLTISSAKNVTATFTPAFALNVTFSGTGSGSVRSSPQNYIMCIKGSVIGCSGMFGTAEEVTLTAVPDSATSTFSGWNIPGCSATACKITMDTDKTVTAAFTLAPKSKLDVTTEGGYATLTDAYSNATSTIFAMNSVFTEEWTLNLNKSILFKGGYQADYATRTGFTILNGLLTIKNGSLKVEGLKLK